MSSTRPGHLPSRTLDGVHPVEIGPVAAIHLEVIGASLKQLAFQSRRLGGIPMCVGDGGTVCLKVKGSAHVIVDVAGWFG